MLWANSAGLLSFSLFFCLLSARSFDAKILATRLMLAHIWIILPFFLSSFLPSFRSLGSFVLLIGQRGVFRHYMYYGWAKRIVYAVTGTSHWRSFRGGVQRTALWLCRRRRICRLVLGKQKLSSLHKCKFTFHGFFLSSGIRVDIIAVVF